MKALMSAYIELNWCETPNLTVEGFVNFCLESKNPKTRALFLAMYHFGMPPIVKRIALRLLRKDIADGGSALGKGRLQNSKPGQTWETIPTSPDPPALPPQDGNFFKVGNGIGGSDPPVLPGFPNFEVGKWFLYKEMGRSGHWTFTNQPNF